MIDLTPNPVVTVAIPTYNGQRFLGLVLRALASQTAPAEAFEVVVVDNNSTTDLFAGSGTAEALAALRERGTEFRCVREANQGLTFARAAGVRAARAPVVCFLDDDNEPVPGYVAAGLCALTDPGVGLLVSRVYPVYERVPSPAVRRREHLLAINHKLGDASIRWPAARPVCPALGAGLWVRKALFESVYAGLGDRGMSDRVGTTLASGGDIELGIGVGRLGYDRLYVPELVIRHHIPAGRVEPGYIVRMIDGIVRSEALIQERYIGVRPSLAVRVGRLVASLALGWAVAAVRGDFFREYRFIVSAAVSRCRGVLPGT